LFLHPDSEKRDSVEGHRLPDFAREIGAENWAQFFLKWVISHPAVTCAIPATTNPDHESENIGALKGPLPDKEMRARMVKHMETIPGFDKLAAMPPYPDKVFNGIIRRAQSQRQAGGKKKSEGVEPGVLVGGGQRPFEVDYQSGHLPAFFRRRSPLIDGEGIDSRAFQESF
jgi:hypothetical protein